MKRTLIALIAAAAIASPALAASATFDVDLSIDRSQMQTVEGAATAYETIKQDISEECAVQHEGARFLSDRLTETCTRRTLAKAVTSIGEPNLTAVHSQAVKAAK